MGKFLDFSGLKKAFNIVKSYIDETHMVEVTYSELVKLRDEKKLVAGRQYRITDYECTTTQEGTQSAGHQFDIIVTADSESVLNEEARAVESAGKEVELSTLTFSNPYDLGPGETYYEHPHGNGGDTYKANSLPCNNIYRSSDDISLFFGKDIPEYTLWGGMDHFPAVMFNGHYYMYTTGEGDYSKNALYIGTEKHNGQTVHVWFTGDDMITGNILYIYTTSTPEEWWTAASASGKLTTSTQPVPTYFADCNLDAWKIWYCLDNNTNRFAWADDSNGKGVIYRMIDEWGNDCPYDFKNILIAKELVNRDKSILFDKDYPLDYYYTFNKSGKEQADGSITGVSHDNVMSKDFNMTDDVCLPCNIIMSTSMKNSIDGSLNVLSTSTGVTITDAGNNYVKDSREVMIGPGANFNWVERAKHITIGNDSCENSIGSSYVYIGKYSGNNRIENNFGNIYIGDNCWGNTVMSSDHIRINDNCSQLVVGYSAWNTSLGCPCSDIVFEGGNSYIGIGDYEGMSGFTSYRFKLGTKGTNSKGISVSYIDKPFGKEYETIVATRSDGTVVTYCEADLITNN